MIYGSPDGEKTVAQASQPQEQFESKGDSEKGELALQNAILDGKKETIQEGKLLNEAMSQGIGAFSPDTLFEQLVKSYSTAVQIYGPSLLRLVTGYDPAYIQRNAKIPEFQIELKKRISEHIEQLKEAGFLDEEGNISEKGVEFASLTLYHEELDSLIPKGLFGEKVHQKESISGEKENTKKHGKYDRYRDIAIRKSIHLAMQRGHPSLARGDLKTFVRKSKGRITIIYAIDASASMKGKKLEQCKRAGIALAYKAIQEKDKVGLLVFGDEISESIPPTDDFKHLAMAITRCRAKRQTDIGKTLKAAIDLFPHWNGTKHLIILTDALPTAGKDPVKETLQAASVASSNGITISLIGLGLNEEGKKLAEQIVQIGNGRLSVIKETDRLDVIVLEDYYSVR